MRRVLPLLVLCISTSLAACGGATSEPIGGSGTGKSTTPPSEQTPDPSQPDPSNPPAPDPDPEPKPPTPIGQQGVAGRVEKWTGNFMPGPGPSAGKITALTVPVHIFTGKVTVHETPDPKDPQLVTIVKSDANGFYSAELAPGEYTVVAEIDGKLYLNSFTGNNEWGSIVVLGGKWTDFKIVDDHDAAF